MSVIDRIRTFFRLVALLTVLAAVAVISAITAMRIALRSGEADLPNLVGMPLEEAQLSAGRLGLGVKVEERLFSDKYPAERIVSQVPAAGTEVKSGQYVHVLVSLGTPKVTVPELVGSSVRVAEITAVQRGLTLGDVATVHWEGAPSDEIVAQDPPVASREVHSPAVDLLVSLGELPAAYVCPNFVGLSISDARRTIEKAGFTVGQVTTPAPPAPPNATGPPAAPGASAPTAPGGAPQAAPMPAAPLAASGTILSQSPPAGSKIGADAVFNFVVAP
jgi:eukaryotic-like serine/threonine-protein kinase